MKKFLVVCLLVMFICSLAHATAENKMSKVGTGAAYVVTPATPVQLSATSQPVNVIYLTGVSKHADGSFALSHDIDNGIFVGGSKVSAGGTENIINMSLRQGICVKSTDCIEIKGGDLNKVYVDSVNTYDGVTYTWFSD